MEQLGITRAPRMPGLTRPVAVLAAIAIVAVACTRDGAPVSVPPGEVEGTVLVFAAASLANAFADLEAAFEAANPKVDVQLNIAGSSALREQILAGAPADVFASADEANMSKLVDAGEVAGGPWIFVRNSLEIVVPAGNTGGLSGLADFARRERKIVV